MLSRSPTYTELNLLQYDNVHIALDDFEECLSETTTAYRVWSVYSRVMKFCNKPHSRDVLISKCLSIAKKGNKWNYSWVSIFLKEQLEK